MLTLIGQLLAGLLLLYVGGELLIRGASSLARRLGISALAIGLTVVAFGTSTPEVVVSVQAALSGANDISLGNVVGSNIANVGLILGVATLIRPLEIQARIVRVDGPVMILVSLGLTVVMLGGGASRMEGGLLLLALVVYTAVTFRQARAEPGPVREEFAGAAPGPETKGWLSVLLVLAGLGILVVGGHFLVTGAVELATRLGVGQNVLGLTIVAVGTSLPELATSLLAAARGQGDIAAGNVVGSNIFNILGILGLTAVIHPLALGAITWIDLGVMVAVAVVVTAFLFTRLRLGRGEGLLLLVAWVAYTGWLVTAG